LKFGDVFPRNVMAAIEDLEELAAKGDPAGQHGLGYLHATGLGFNSSQAKALVYYTFSALGGYTFGEMSLGYRYFNGIGVSKSCETALSYYKRVATKVAAAATSGGDAIHRIRLSEEAEQGTAKIGLLDDDIVQYYQFLAEKGDLQAQVALGQLYYQGGRGVKKDHLKALKYFKMATKATDGIGDAFLGKLYSEGSRNIKQSNRTALEYFRKSVDKKSPIGYCGLGDMYLHGKGLAKDYKKAFSLFSLSAQQGWADGQLQLGLMHYKGLGTPKDLKQAVKYFNLASQSGHILAIYHLGMLHATGNGIIRSCHTATELLKTVAERGQWSRILMEAYNAFKNGQISDALIKYGFMAELGYEIAQSNVAYILDKGKKLFAYICEASHIRETEKYPRALLQWSRAASQGSTVALVKVGDYHYYGFGTKVDYEAAALNYRVASEQQNNAQAMFNLAYMHERGLGLKRDMHLAKRYYDMASEASTEAYIPVKLALAKLSFLYTAEWLRHVSKSGKQDDVKLDKSLTNNWDLYLMAILIGFLIIVIIMRRR
ncbi:uncharacterized protein TRIADDRAFT_32291, partial [Trichoplax adhaerens]